MALHESQKWIPIYGSEGAIPVIAGMVKLSRLKQWEFVLVTALRLKRIPVT